MTLRDILVYAPINLNIIDGSSIWLRSICETLSLIDGVSVDTLLYANYKDEPVRIDGVRHHWLPSHYLFTGSGLQSLAKGDLLEPAAAADALLILQSIKNYTHLMVRGLNAAHSLATCHGRQQKLLVYLTDIDEGWVWEKQSEGIERLREVVDQASLVFCQTPSLSSLIEELVPAASSKIAKLPPMVPDRVFRKKEQPKTSKNRIIYAGKFAPEWGIDEMFEALKVLEDERVSLDFHVYGNKIQGDSHEFRQRIAETLKAELGFVWHGGVSRHAILEEMPNFDFGYAYRHARLDASVEISTKLLEYVATNIAPILNRTALHEEYFGKEYPFFVNSKEDLIKVMRVIGSGGNFSVDVLDKARAKVENHRMSSISKSISRSLDRIDPVSVDHPARLKYKLNLLIVSHETKFMADLYQSFFNDEHYNINHVIWPTFQKGGEAETSAAMNGADVIFCEWATGNAVFCSKNKKPHQKLIVRFHRFELVTDFPAQIDIHAVDQVITVSEHMARQIKELYGWPDNKVSVIPNSIDVDDLDRQKTRYARFNLGLMGVLPQLKRLDVSLDLLARLRSHDTRFCLHLKGKMPWHLPWLWANSSQQEYYLKQFKRIREEEFLKGAVTYDHFGPDVARWFQKIGWILSPSDIESFHLAGIEGMASGAVPVVSNRLGSKEIFPDKNVFDSLDDMDEFITSSTDDDGHMWRKLGAEAKLTAKIYDKDNVMDMWHGILVRFGVI